jgi:cytochrome c-type biogenesis protein
VTESLGVFVAFSAGLFSFLSPCVLPLFPSYLSFITGMSVDRLTHEVTAGARTRVLVHSVAFILGFSVVFVSLGASFSAAGQFLLDYREWIRIAGGLLIVVFGLYIAGILRIGIFGRTQQLQVQSKPAGLLGSFLVGLTFAIGWTPCVGPILGSILTLASNDKTVGQGVTLLLFYSAGLGIPFMATGLAFGRLAGALNWVKRHSTVITATSALALGFFGFLLAVNQFTWLTAKLSDGLRAIGLGRLLTLG